MNLQQALEAMMRGPTEADVEAALARVTALRAAHPDRSTDLLVHETIARTAR